MENETIQILELFGGIGSPRCALRNVKASISQNSKGEINVERTETKKQKLTE